MELNYTGLLNTIALGESKGNYNAYFGSAHNNGIDFTAMAVGEVLEWQANFVAQVISCVYDVAYGYKV